MRRVALSFLLTFAFAFYGAAWQTGSTSGQETPGGTQSGTTQSTTPESSTQTRTTRNQARSVNSITGCLQAGAAGTDTYTLQGTDVGNVQVVPSSRIKNDISKHIGHEVRLVGNWANMQGGTSASSTEGTSTSQTARSNAGSNLPQSDQPMAGKTFRANRIDMVSDNCSQKQ